MADQEGTTTQEPTKSFLGMNEEMLKWALIIAVLTGTNVGQFLGIAMPERAQVEIVKQERSGLSVELDQCYGALRQCYRECISEVTP